MTAIPPTPEPLLPLQNYHWRYLEVLQCVNPVLPGFLPSVLDMEDNVRRYGQMQAWLQVSRFWYYVIGQPMAHDEDYDQVVKAAIHEHEEDFEACPLPMYWYWNYLPDRYSKWVVDLFFNTPHNPRYPWLYAEGPYRRPLDFSVQFSSGKSGGKTIAKPLEFNLKFPEGD